MTMLTSLVGACGPADSALDSRSEGLGFDSQCWPCVEVSGKLRIPHCLGPPSRNGYLVHRSKVGSIVAGCIGTHLARAKVKSVEHALSWSLDSKQLPLPLPLGNDKIDYDNDYRANASFYLDPPLCGYWAFLQENNTQASH